MSKIIAHISRFPTLYKIASNGQELSWQIAIDGSQFWTIEGVVGGKLTPSLPTVCKPKNIGRANQTTAEEQAEKEAQAKWQKKLDSGYFHTIEEARGSKFFRPMLAEKFEDRLDEIEWQFPVFSSPKLDGIRCIARKEGLFSRNGKPIVSCPHIHDLLKPIFDKYPDSVFDGELYNHDFRDNFNKIVSLTKKTKPTKEDLLESNRLVQYWIFDYSSDTYYIEPFQERIDVATSLMEKFSIPQHAIRIVKQLRCKDLNELNHKYDRYLQFGFEGQMIRWGLVGYQNKRSKYLLKRKEFIDEEFEIVDIIEGDGNRTGVAGYAKIRLPKTVNKNIYPDGIGKSNIKGDFDFLRRLLQDRKKVIGKMGTVKFFNYTPDGAPRFPYLISVRDYE